MTLLEVCFLCCEREPLVAEFWSSDAESWVSICEWCAEDHPSAITDPDAVARIREEHP